MTDGSNRKTTLEDLARLAGVSISTVSRALNGQAAISTRTKERIWALARDHNYSLRTSTSSAPAGADGSITIVTPHSRGRALPLSHPFFLELIASIGEAARARGWDFTVSHLAPTSLDDLMLATTASRASGVIFLGQSTMHEALNELVDTNANFVVWGAQMPGQRYRTIGSDNLLGGRRATSHLCRLGRRRILFIGGGDPEALQRRQGYFDALEANGIERSSELVAEVHFELDLADNTVTRLLRRGVTFDGVFAASDLIALGAIRALRRAGLSVPADVSVVGYDDMLLSRLSSPALSTIRQDTQRAGQLLVASIFDNHADDLPSMLPTELIIRESCGG
jgi:DNA-binding LacI/PurR family transcriptional regulator